MSTSTPTETSRKRAQNMAALGNANSLRSDKAKLRRQMRNGSITLARILEERPEPLRSTPLFTLVLDLPGFGQRRLEQLNRRALIDQVNLALTLAAASAHTLGWLLKEITGQVAAPVDAVVDDGEAWEDIVRIPEPAVDDDDWRSVALALDTLVLEHERDVYDESLPVERWALADGQLHRSRALIMAHAPFREETDGGEP